ncbi:homeobox and leucine zipper encoding b [Labrus bergylta]|uniref:homeobox and leucine zipper encoding b n=1 Tax=Labrus bergylta TaxID=56723 RepID=UPI00331440A0
MRNTQTADGGPPIVRQNTPDAPAETLSEINSIPMSFTMNQSIAICLPVVSDSQRLIWVHSNQMEQNLEAAAELGKAFDKFPYLTQKQTAALAGRCSLHPDHVKVWFMVQRLRFGISWDYRDIRMVRNQFKSNQGKKKEEKTDGGEKKTRKVDDKKSGMVGENVRAYEQMEKNMKLEQQMKKEKDGKVKEDEKGTRRKRKRRKVTAKMGETQIKQGNRYEGTRCWPFNSFDEPSLADSQSEPLKRVDPKPSSTLNAHDTTGKTTMSAKLEEEEHAKSSNPGDTVTDVDKLKMLIDANDNPIMDQHAEEKVTLPAKIRCPAKTQTQVEMMRMAFLHCQYPDSNEYEHLSLLIGIPRYLLVQWYGDTRYLIKKGRPRWMSEEQHCRTLANVKYRQYQKKLERLQKVESP